MNIFLSRSDLRGMPNAREKIIFLLTVIVCLFVFFKSCWYPSQRAISSVKSDIEVIKKEQTKVEKAQKEAKKNVKQVWSGTEEIREKYNQYAKKVALEPDSFLMREFSNPVLLKDIRLVAVNFADNKNDGNIITQKFDLSLSGSFVSILDYLNRLDKLPLLLVLNEINIDSEENKQGRVTLEINGVAYGWR
ncbi:MAG: type 4a pilus biogenesis protein PilO [Pseudomonadota bacterium]